MIKCLQIACVLALTSTIGSLSKAEAATIIFTDRAAFTAAVQPNATILFDVPGTVHCDFAQGCPPFLIFDDGLFRFKEDFVFFMASGASGPNEGSLDYLSIGSFSPGISGTLVPSLAVGFDISPRGGTVTVATVGGTFFTIEAPQFLGFQFDEPITQLAWFLAPPGQGLSGKTAIVDNIVLKTVPEPSMLLLFGSAAAMLFAHRRRVKESR